MGVMLEPESSIGRGEDMAGTADRGNSEEYAD